RPAPSLRRRQEERLRPRAGRPRDPRVRQREDGLRRPILNATSAMLATTSAVGTAGIGARRWVTAQPLSAPASPEAASRAGDAGSVGELSVVLVPLGATFVSGSSSSAS